jgi:hypothetical protein
MAAIACFRITVLDELDDGCVIDNGLSIWWYAKTGDAVSDRRQSFTFNRSFVHFTRFAEPSLAINQTRYNPLTTRIDGLIGFKIVGWRAYTDN